MYNTVNLQHHMDKNKIWEHSALSNVDTSFTKT